MIFGGFLFVYKTADKLKKQSVLEIFGNQRRAKRRKHVDGQ